MPKVLVTSGNTRVAYAICCSLAAKGYEVYIGDTSLFTMAGMSRYCKGSMKYPSPFTMQESFINSISSFVHAKKIDILIPVLEETYTCLKHIDILKRCGVAVLFPTYEQALKIHAKGSLTAIAKEIGIDTPPTLELTEIIASKEALNTLTFPVILKPKQGGGGWGMERFSNPEEFYKIVTTQIDNPENYIVQSIIIGELIGACGIYHQGKHIISDSYKLTTSYPLYVGQSTTRLSVNYPSAIEAVKKLLGHLGWNGVCQMDFIYEPSTNKSYLIDANPRFWGSVKHNIAAGVDYPYYYALLAQNITDFTVNEAKENTRSRWLGGDILRVIAECREAKSSLEYIRNAIFKPTKYQANDDWNIKDPLPFITWALNLVLKRVLRRKKDSLPGVWE